jgi:hypothetical protein
LFLSIRHCRYPLGIRALAATVTLFLCAVARADEGSDLEKAYGAYVAHRYDDAEARLRRLLDGKDALKDADSVADARMYLGAVLIAEGRKEEADRVFEQLLLDKPDYQPDPLRVALPALDAVVDAHTRLRDALRTILADRVRREQEEQKRIEGEKTRAEAALRQLETLASQEVIVERHSRWEALLPFGVGQFQNGDRALGWTFLVTESLLAAGSAVGIGLGLYNESQAYDAFTNGQGTAPGYQARASDSVVVGDVLGLSFAAVAALGVAQAELGFVPERVHVQPRKHAFGFAPSAPSPSPGPAPSPSTPSPSSTPAPTSLSTRAPMPPAGGVSLAVGPLGFALVGRF